ncbi:hypothetical protein [Thalassotalea marina]|uniref:Letm1 RBD domain-containing protein n=1 Tax=Thalassotalea marina TaxID=1673741 RepID=A0A919BEW0_9GAMM|nr:hypothetical protein [Thalassotalea marina]GHF87473.1 hypothetical protein GCM10017161_13820 [Thalassotalea marina]
MKIWTHFFKAPIRVLSISRRQHLSKLKRQLVLIKNALAQEKNGTKEMLAIYRRYTLRQATIEEMKQANKQFVDLLKGLGLGVFVVLPFAPITIPLAIKLGKWVGVDILPKSFSQLGNKAVKVTLDKKLPDQSRNE